MERLGSIVEWGVGIDAAGVFRGSARIGVREKSRDSSIYAAIPAAADDRHVGPNRAGWSGCPVRVLDPHRLLALAGRPEPTGA
ncbi:MAG: hypothetical protein JWO38_4671 [Gemmataceae bacterium]|nr:hypothetical protein [Gemmataceae bacterium]